MATKETRAHGNTPAKDTPAKPAAADGPDLPDLEPGELKELLRLMILARRFEEKAAESYQLGKIGGFLHLYIGQEAVAAGAITALREDDYVISSEFLPLQEVRRLELGDEKAFLEAAVEAMGLTDRGQM